MDEWPKPWRDQPGAGGRDEVVTTDTVGGSGYAWVSGSMFIKRRSSLEGDRGSADIESPGSAFSHVERPESSNDRFTDDVEM